MRDKDAPIRIVCVRNDEIEKHDFLAIAQTSTWKLMFNNQQNIGACFCFATSGGTKKTSFITWYTSLGHSSKGNEQKKDRGEKGRATVYIEGVEIELREIQQEERESYDKRRGESVCGRERERDVGHFNLGF